jgi:hypothetical protein
MDKILKWVESALKQGSVTVEFIKPFIDVLTAWSKHSGVAKALQVSPAKLKVSCVNASSVATALAEMRMAVTTFRDNTTASDGDVANSLMTLKSCVFKGQKIVDSPPTASVKSMEQFIDNGCLFAKQLIEGCKSSEKPLIGLQEILSHAVRQQLEKNMAAMTEQLKNLKKVAGGMSDGKLWNEKLKEDDSWSAVLEQANTSLLKIDAAATDAIVNSLVEASLTTQFMGFGPFGSCFATHRLGLADDVAASGPLSVSARCCGEVISYSAAVSGSTLSE